MNVMKTPAGEVVNALRQAGETMLTQQQDEGEAVLVVIARGVTAQQLGAVVAAIGMPATDGGRMVARERREQIQRWGDEHDDVEHVYGELQAAAMCYAAAPGPEQERYVHWPWAQGDWKPRSRAENLIRGGALYQAEIDRHLRHVAELVRYRDLAVENLNAELRAETLRGLAILAEEGEVVGMERAARGEVGG